MDLNRKLTSLSTINLALGDPLIKGLTEVANKRPADPITYLATYLYNFANQNRTKTSASSQTIESAKNDSNNNSIEIAVNEDAEKDMEATVETVEAPLIPQMNGVAEQPLSGDEQVSSSPDSVQNAASSDTRVSPLKFIPFHSDVKRHLILKIKLPG